MSIRYDATLAALRWAPPTQVAPTVINVPSGFYSGSFGSSEDVIFNWPTGVTRTSEFIATGGRNVRIIGGASAKGAGGSAIQITGCTGSVFIEGVAIDNVSANIDAINACGNTSPAYTLFPDVYIQNCRLLNINGTAATNHSDAFQAQGSIGNLFIDRVTLSSNHQGLSIFQGQNPISRAYISRVNGTYIAGGDPTTYLLWNMDQATNAPYAPVFLDQVYFTPRGGQNLGDCSYPSPGIVNSSAQAIGITTTDAWTTASYPAITNCYGLIRTGAPAGGDWAAAGNVGLSYVSPGYQNFSSGTLPLTGIG